MKTQQIRIGSRVDGGDPLTVDLREMMISRLLIQAGSGGGKSWLLRILAERFFGHVQVVIIDPEGEFASLRERFDYILAAKNGGDTSIAIPSAELLAHRILELNASAVCDIYECKPDERHEWVAAFVSALVDAPKKLWKPLLLIIDEAHIFCPEKGFGESPAATPITDAGTRGRKRGQCVVLATQRLGALRKSAAAECHNKIIGRTILDIDLDRAAKDLGVVGKSDRDRLFYQLKRMPAGQFFALGRALAVDAVQLQVDKDIKTTHPDLITLGTGASIEVPPAPEAIRHLLPQLADLPKQAEEKKRTEADLRAEIADLKRQVDRAPVAAPAKTITREVIQTKRVPYVPPEVRAAVRAIVKLAAGLPKVIETAAQVEASLATLPDPVTVGPAVPLVVEPDEDIMKAIQDGRLTSPDGINWTNRQAYPEAPDLNPTAGRAVPDRMLAALKHAGRPLTPDRLALLSGTHRTRSTYRAAVGRLKRLGLATIDRGAFALTGAGQAATVDVKRPANPIVMWREALDGRLAKAILDLLVHEPGPFAKPEIAKRCGSDHTLSTFRAAFGQLSTARLVQRRAGGFTLSDDLR